VHASRYLLRAQSVGIGIAVRCKSTPTVAIVAPVICSLIIDFVVGTTMTKIGKSHQAESRDFGQRDHDVILDRPFDDANRGSARWEHSCFQTEERRDGD
jgi:hypothetical protein